MCVCVWPHYTHYQYSCSQGAFYHSYILYRYIAAVLARVHSTIYVAVNRGKDLACRGMLIMQSGEHSWVGSYS